MIFTFQTNPAEGSTGTQALHDGGVSLPVTAICIGIHPIKRFHAFPSNFLVRGLYVTNCRSIHPTFGFHAYPITGQGSVDGRHVGGTILAPLSNCDHPDVSRKKLPVSTPEIMLVVVAEKSTSQALLRVSNWP